MFEHLSLSKYTDYITKMCFSMLSFFQIIYMLKQKLCFIQRRGLCCMEIIARKRHEARKLFSADEKTR